MPSLLEEIMRRRRPELAGILGGDTPSSSTARVAQATGLLGQAPPSRPGGLLDPRTSAPSRVNPPVGSQPTIPNQQRVSAPGGQLPSLQQQQQAQFRAQTEQMRRQGEQQLRARQAQQQGVGRNREPGPGEKGLSFFAKLFTGNRIEGLKRQEQESLLQPALIRAGLTMLAAPVGTPWPQALAAGILAGRQEATTTAGALLDEKRAQQRVIQYRRIFEDTDLSEIEQWREARKVAVKRGDMESVKTFNDVLEGLEGAGANQENWKYDEINGMPVWVDAENREIRDLEGNLVHQAPELPKDEDEVFQRTNALADDFRSETRALQETLALAGSAPQAGDNSAGDLRLIFVFNKLIDPGSRITEGEVQAGKNLGGLSAQARGFVDRFAEGRLPGPARQELLGEIEQMRESRAQQLGGIAQQYRERARAFGVRPDFVVRRGLIPDLGGEDSQNGNGGQVSTGAGTSGAPTLFPEDEDEGGI